MLKIIVMILLVVIYSVGFFAVPILGIYLDKRFKNCMDITFSGDRNMFYALSSFIWPIMLFIFFFLLLEYWYKLK